MQLAKDGKVAAISGLSDLITSLNDEITSPKEIAQQVEDVIVSISIKDNTTDFEKLLKSTLENYQEKLMTGEIEFQEEGYGPPSFR